MLADELNLKRETVRKILTDDLSMKKLCANMVPKNLLAEQKHVQMSISQDCLEQVEADPTLLDRVITGDESWYFQYDPETKRQSQQWLSPGAARPKKARTMMICFFDSKGIVHKEFVPPGQTVNQHFYLKVLDRLRKRVIRVRPEIAKTWILHHDNAPCHRAFSVSRFLTSKNIAVLPQAPYSPDMSPCDFFLFPQTKLVVKGTHFESITDIQNAVTRVLQDIPVEAFQKCYESWKKRWNQYLRSSSNEYVCDQSRPCTSHEQYLDTNDTLVISGMSNDVCDSALVEKTNIGTEEEKQLLMRQLQISTGKSICPILRKFAMTLHFYSPSAYSYVRTIFSKALPDVSTIRKWYSKLDGLPGMTKESFQAISLKVKEMKVNGKQLYGCLVMDEMSIKQHVHWTGTRHQGYIDFGLGGKTEEMDNLPYAKDAFVIMVVDINTSWKVPIAYYLINGISAEEKANIILNCLQELDTTGVIIKTLTFDGAANNLSMASELEANLQYSELKPYFLHPNTNDKKLPWRLEDINESGLHSATKLRNRHIYYFREKMKVRLVVQTFSTSVANAILFCMNDLKLDNFQGADATIEFCLSINNIFDILNTRNFLSKGTYNKSINKRTKTEIFHYIEESIDYLAGGFNALKNQQNVDHIEMLFSAIRAKGGFNNNPTVSQFEAAYKSIIVHSEIKSSSSANCMALDDTTILTVSSSNIKVKDTQSELLDLLCVAGTDDLEKDNLLSVYQHSNFINDVVACIAGFVVRKIKKKQFYVIHVL
ncbi:hypothetical protein QTP88_000050 [Uroleucon formosanum]